MIRSFTYLLVAGATAGLTGFNATAKGASPAQLPFYFESNGGTFQATGPGAQCIISPAGAALILRDGKAAPATIRLQFAGANPQATFHGETAQGGKINHLIGTASSQWQLNETAYGQVRAEDVYPGISAVFYGNARRLEYDLNVAPGAKPEAISLQFAGADKITVAPDGQLLLAVAGREISQPAPVVYQVIDGTRHEVAGGYRLADSHTVAFSIGAYDHSQTLVIDPYLSFSTYFGGNSTDVPLAISVDSQGYIYLAGSTVSTLFTNNIPATGYKTNFQGGTSSGDGFVAKFDAQGTNLVYFTYLGGSSEDGVESIAVDAQGQAYLAGFTQSPNFPTNNTFAPLTNKISGSLINRLGVYPSDVFVTKLSADGSSLIFSGYLGGDQSDSATSLTLDTNRNVLYITGYTSSTNFPTSPNAYQNHFKAPASIYFANAFVTAIGTGYAAAFPAAGSSYYSTYFGGTNLDVGMGIGLDGAGNIYVTGYTSSTNFPTTNSLAGMSRLNESTNTQPVFSAYQYDAFVAKFSAGATILPSGMPRP